MEHPYSLHRHLQLDFKTDYELANRLCCISDWAGEQLRNEKQALAASTCQTLERIA